MILSAFQHGLRHWREWELNPVVVKELRQSVRSWAVTGMLLLFLTVLFITSLVFLVDQSFETSVNQRLGASVFRAFLVILTGASILFIPLYVGVRLAVERQESNLDLLYVTSLTPGRIIRGKFLCGAYMAVLFFSACMPFMVFTNLLRGVDLPTIFFILLCLFLAVCAAVQVAIFLACLPLTRLFKSLLALIGTIAAFMLIVPLAALFFEMMQSGIGSMIVGGREFWAGFFTGVALVVAAALLLYFLSVALIAPASANRALPLRLYLTAVWLLGSALSLAWMRGIRDARAILPWAILSFLVLAVALVVVVSNRDELSLRVRRAIPGPGWKRALAFVFYNGAAGGLVWISLLLAASFAMTSLTLRQAWPWGGHHSSFNPSEQREFDLAAGAMVLYTMDYALTALWLHRRFLGRRPARLAGVMAVLLPGAWALVPTIGLFFLDRLSWKSLEKFQPGNVFNIFSLRDQDQMWFHLFVAAGWILIMAGLNAKWFARQVRDFRPLDPAGLAIEPPPTTLPPPVPGAAGETRD